MRKEAFWAFVTDITFTFKQTFELPLHQGWNTVVADFSTPLPGEVVSDLKPGANPSEKFYFFGAASR